MRNSTLGLISFVGGMMSYLMYNIYIQKYQSNTDTEQYDDAVSDLSDCNCNYKSFHQISKIREKLEELINEL
jgi:hypothetical protein